MSSILEKESIKKLVLGNMKEVFRGIMVRCELNYLGCIACRLLPVAVLSLFKDSPTLRV
jgi:hypothetical protein